MSSKGKSLDKNDSKQTELILCSICQKDNKGKSKQFHNTRHLRYHETYFHEGKFSR